MEAYQILVLDGQAGMEANPQLQADTIFNRDNYEALSKRIETLCPEAKPAWGKMNIIEMLIHLKISIGSGLGIYRLKDESSWYTRNIVKYIILNVFTRFPKNISSPKSFTPHATEGIAFKSVKAALLKNLNQVFYSPFPVLPHPLYGNMERSSWGRLVYRHIDHHLRQFQN